MTSTISSLVKIWKTRNYGPGCKFTWILRVVYFSVKHSRLYVITSIKNPWLSTKNTFLLLQQVIKTLATEFISDVYSNSTTNLQGQFTSVREKKYHKNLQSRHKSPCTTSRLDHRCKRTRNLEVLFYIIRFFSPKSVTFILIKNYFVITEWRCTFILCMQESPSYNDGIEDFDLMIGLTENTITVPAASFCTNTSLLRLSFLFISSVFFCFFVCFF